MLFYFWFLMWLLFCFVSIVRAFLTNNRYSIRLKQFLRVLPRKAKNLLPDNCLCKCLIINSVEARFCCCCCWCCCCCCCCCCLICCCCCFNLAAAKSLWLCCCCCCLFTELCWNWFWNAGCICATGFICACADDTGSGSCIVAWACGCGWIARGPVNENWGCCWTCCCCCCICCCCLCCCCCWTSCCCCCGCIGRVRAWDTVRPW